MLTTILLASCLSVSSADADARAALALVSTTVADEKKCKMCSAQCDCSCQSGEKCRCAPAAAPVTPLGEPDTDGWRWTRKSDGYWYQWRYVEARPTILAPIISMQYPTAPRTSSLCVGGG